MTSQLPPGRLPDFFIVGAPKCGTTSMYAYLRQHPQIFMPFHKEPLYFGADLTRRYGRMKPEEYLALFQSASEDQLVGEASAWYLYSETAAREIRDAVPDAKIIAMFRDPVDVMHAQHAQLLYTRQEDIADFGEALAAEPERVAGRRLPPGPIRPENLYYRRMVRFADQLERYLDIFGRDRVHVILHDDLQADTAAVYRRVLAFLGVDPDVSVDFSRRNERKRARFGWLQRLVWDPPFVRHLAPVLRRFPIVHRLRAGLLSLNSVPEARRGVDARLRSALVRELTPGISRLGALVDRDLSHWAASPGPGNE